MREQRRTSRGGSLGWRPAQGKEMGYGAGQRTEAGAEGLTFRSRESL